MASPSTAPKTGGVTDEENQELMERLRAMHLEDMPAIFDRGTGTLGWFRRLASDLAYYAKWFVITWWSALTNLPNFVVDPMGAASVIMFAAGGTVILGVMLVIAAIWRLTAVQVVWRRISEKKGGVGLANIAYPEIFSSLKPSIREAAYQVMRNPLSEFAQPSTSTTRIFDLEVSKLLFCCASLVYERDEVEIETAFKRMAEVTRKFKKLGRSVAGFSMAESGTDRQGVLAHMDKADEYIVKTARQWGLHYISISELATNTSPLCGAFWHPRHNFIILSFKGTNPVEFKEWAVDFTFNYTEGGAWLPGYGKVHSGFYDSIFPSDTTKSHGVFPYEQIRSRVQEIAKVLVKNSNDNRVNLYITGHSLGAALASFCFARAVASPRDFGQNTSGDDLVRVRDAYCYGVPIFGDPENIGAFGRSIHANLEQPLTLWRVTNRHDPVGTMLPEAGDYKMWSHISPLSQLHFSHIGQEIQIRRRRNKAGTGPRVGTGPGTLLPKGAKVKIISHLSGSGAGPEVELSLAGKILEWTPIISRLFSHIPSCYWVHLAAVETDENVEWLRRENALVSM
ncbi:hypothetical protein ACQY0O_001339 [Thecaphora frezii]